jgi:hypothetical protein
VSESERAMFRRFVQVVVNATRKGKVEALFLSPFEVTTLNGAIGLVMRHPEVRAKLKDANAILAGIREKTILLMVGLGFTRQEAEWLSSHDVEEKTEERGGGPNGNKRY